MLEPDADLWLPFDTEADAHAALADLTRWEPTHNLATTKTSYPGVRHVGHAARLARSSCVLARSWLAEVGHECLRRRWGELTVRPARLQPDVVDVNGGVVRTRPADVLSGEWLTLAPGCDVGTHARSCDDIDPVPPGVPR